jgi:uncharacterized protein with NRDE domain
MCLLILAHRTAPGYPLVVAANRDEFHQRRAAASDFWPDHPQLLAGRDLQLGGTWMGITRGGRFAAVTNFRDPSRTAPAPRSRGELPLHYLLGDETPEVFLRGAAAQADDYAGFNLLLGNRDSLWYFNNSQPAAGRLPRCLPPGIYGLSNARLDTPWPKVNLGKHKMELLLREGKPTHAALAEVVSDRRLAGPEALRCQGMDSGMDRLLSAQFIITGSYGTRASTTLWTSDEGLVCWRERSFDAHGVARTVREREFRLTPRDCG